MNVFKIVSMVAGCLSIASTLMGNWAQDRTMKSVIKAEVEKALKSK